MIVSWDLALRAANKSEKTIRSYLDSARALQRYLRNQGRQADTESVTVSDIQEFLLAELERASAATASHHFRNLRVFWNWVGQEGERTATSPMAGVQAPKVPRDVKQPFDEDSVRALLASCKGSGFEDRRDYAQILIMFDNGMRVSSLTGLRYHPTEEERTDVFLRKHLLRIRKKGGDHYYVPIGKKTAAAIDRYLRARAGHPKSDSPNLWLGTRGHSTDGMTSSGVSQMLKRRARTAGIPQVHPHRFRRTFADNFLEEGGNLDDLMVIGGWANYKSVEPYLEGRKAKRAQIAHGRLSPADKL